MTTTTRPIRHRPDCDDPDNTHEFIGHEGDPMIRCKSCGRFRILEHPTPDTTRQALPATARYVCGWHHHEPVNWRGKGCATCTRERRSA